MSLYYILKQSCLYNFSEFLVSSAYIYTDTVAVGLSEIWILF